MRRWIQVMAVVLSGVGTSCTHYYYAPSLPLAPGFQQRGDIMVGGGGGIQSSSTSAELNGGYALSNHLFAAAEAGFYEGRAYRGNEGKGQYLGLAGGWYHVAERSPRFAWLFSAHTAFQQAKVQNIYYRELYLTDQAPMYQGRSDFSFRKYYVEPSVAMLSGVVRLHFSLRLGAFRYHSMQLAPAFPNTLSNEMVPELNRSYPVVEPGIVMCVGHRNGQFQLKFVQMSQRQLVGVETRNIGITWVLYPNRFFE
jgi:hypothetical protein